MTARSSGPTRTGKLEQLLDEASTLSHSNPRRGLAAATEAESLAHLAGRRADEAYALLYSAMNHFALSAYGDVLKAATAANRIFASIDDLYGQSRAVMMFGIVYSHLADYPEAATALDEALLLARRAGNVRQEALVRSNLIYMETEMGAFASAIALVQENRALCTSDDDPRFQASLKKSEAYAYLKHGLDDIGNGFHDAASQHLHIAMTVAQEALALDESIGNVRGQMTCLNTIAQVQEARGDLAAASDTLDRVLKLSAQTGIQRASVAARRTMGAIALRNHEYERATEILLEALAMSEEEGASDYTVEICRQLSEVCEAAGDARGALRYSRRATKMEHLIKVDGARRRSRLVEERRHAEQARRDAAHHQALLHEKETQLNHAGRLVIAGETLAAVSHEISQPLTAITSYLDACLNLVHTPGVPSESLEKPLSSARGQVERISEIVRRLRRFLGRSEPEWIPVDLNAVVAEAAQLMSERLRKGGLVLTTALAADLPRVQGDDILLTQVITNLIANAADAIEAGDGGERMIDIASTHDRVHARVTVRDTGPGLQMEDIRRIFQPFVSTKPDGMGLGLAIARSIARSHGGDLAAFPRSSGAEFVLTLPLYAWQAKTPD